MTMTEFTELVKDMREAQEAYKVKRGGTIEEAHAKGYAEALERYVDRTVEAFNPTPALWSGPPTTPIHEADLLVS